MDSKKWVILIAFILILIVFRVLYTLFTKSVYKMFAVNKFDKVYKYYQKNNELSFNDSKSKSLYFLSVLLIIIIIYFLIKQEYMLLLVMGSLLAFLLKKPSNNSTKTVVNIDNNKITFQDMVYDLDEIIDIQYKFYISSVEVESERDDLSVYITTKTGSDEITFYNSQHFNKVLSIILIIKIILIKEDDLDKKNLYKILSSCEITDKKNMIF